MDKMNENMVIPEHVAIILDGNGRWAKKRGLPRSVGHKEGCVTVERTVEDAARLGIKYLTVYGFSTENWKRTSDEVGALMQLFRNDKGQACIAFRLFHQFTDSLYNILVKPFPVTDHLYTHIIGFGNF